MSYFFYNEIEFQVIAIVLLVAVAVQAENCQVGGSPLFSYFSAGFEFSISNISRKKFGFFSSFNFLFEFCQVLNQELVGQNEKFLYICSFFYTVCRSTGVDLRRSSAKWWEFLSFYMWTILFSFGFIDCFSLSLTFYLLTVSAKARVSSDSWWSLWGRRGLGLYWGDCQWEYCHDHYYHLHLFYTSTSI